MSELSKAFEIMLELEPELSRGLGTGGAKALMAEVENLGSGAATGAESMRALHLRTHELLLKLLNGTDDSEAVLNLLNAQLALLTEIKDLIEKQEFEALATKVTSATEAITAAIEAAGGTVVIGEPGTELSNGSIASLINHIRTGLSKERLRRESQLETLLAPAVKLTREFRYPEPLAGWVQYMAPTSSSYGGRKRETQKLLAHPDLQDYIKAAGESEGVWFSTFLYNHAKESSNMRGISDAVNNANAAYNA